MSGSKLFQRIMHTDRYTYPAMKRLVAAMDKLANSGNKKSWFGSDPRNRAFHLFQSRLLETMTAMERDGLIDNESSPSAVFEALTIQMERFKLAHPKWNHAYRFADTFFDPNDRLFNAQAMIGRLRKI